MSNLPYYISTAQIEHRLIDSPFSTHVTAENIKRAADYSSFVYSLKPQISNLGYSTRIMSLVCLHTRELEKLIRQFWLLQRLRPLQPVQFTINHGLALTMDVDMWPVCSTCAMSVYQNQKARMTMTNLPSAQISPSSSSSLPAAPLRPAHSMHR